MTNHFRLAAVSAAAVIVCSPVYAQQQLIEQAAAAMGGRERVLAARTLVMEGEGTNGNLGQDMTPDANGQRFKLSDYKRSIDLAQNRARTEQTRTPDFVYFQGPQPQKQVLGIDGDVAYNIAPTGAATRVAGQAAWDRRIEYYHHPLTIVRAALAPGAKLSNERTEGHERLVDVGVADGMQVTLAIDTATTHPSRVISKTDNPVLGDVLVETTFGDYATVGLLELPATLTTKTDKFITAEVHVARQTVNADTGDLAAPPPTPPTAGAPAAASGVTVTSEAVAPGIWLLAGQSHHSVLVEFTDHLALIEAPQSEARALAVIAKAREIRPGKRLTQVVMTHHHFDHSGGIRAAISEGLAVVTHDGNAAFVQEIAKRPHTLVPDALSKSPKPATVVPVGAPLTIQDASMAMVVYPIAGNPHTDTMVMAYFPNAKVLVQADVFPQPAAPAYQSNLLENIRKHSLQVERIVGIHGTIQPFSALEQAVGAAK
jgi:glyoxylase-like metal-dependent hydrolase (beta-lactamase superfamily II)